MEQKSNRSRSQWTEIIKLSNVENRCARIIEKYVGEMKRSALVQMIFDDDKRQNAGKTFIALLFLICRACPSLLSSSSLSKIFFNQEWKELKAGLKLKLNGNVRRISLFRRNCIVILSSCCHSYRIIIPWYYCSIKQYGEIKFVSRAEKYGRIMEFFSMQCE